MPGPSTTRSADRKAARRAFIRAHHPDAGGDPAVFSAGLPPRGDAATPPAHQAVVVTAFRRRSLPVQFGRLLRRWWWRRHHPRVR
ncbi:hypothetical protein [Actinoalloteichus spitiensis]|uniref:hypothetical protein n=1 Tax=Actinoalloteichus spitiensis TaxID=252394 RepID=UPI000A009F14|nr:hypothetical protein [Actinoalloteichus spitiensis]